MAWQSSSQRVGINFENVNFISNEVLVEFDWSNSTKSSLDGLFERISNVGSDVIILDGLNLLANLGKLSQLFQQHLSTSSRPWRELPDDSHLQSQTVKACESRAKIFR